MIVDFGISTVGKSHIKKGTCCQDSHYIKKLSNGWIVAAIADGVGSAKNSHIGSKIASETVVEFCDECMPWDYNIISIKSMMRTAYNYAFKQILRESEQSGEPIESYDTTLSMVIYDGQRIIYGHSGDGAIFGLTTFGDYIEITRPQKSSDGVSVIPLRGGYTQWVIDTYEEDLAAVLLMTDGMLETLCHYLLRNHESKTNRAYVPLASYFMDPFGFSDCDLESAKQEVFDFVIANENYNSSRFYDRLLEIYKKHIPDTAEKVIEELKKFNYPVSLMQSEQDDKTIVGLINTELFFDNKDAAFYAEANWSELQEAWNRKAYPHLYVKSDDKEGQLEDAAEVDTQKANGVELTVEDATNDTVIKDNVTTEKVETEGAIDGTDDVLLIFEKKRATSKSTPIDEASASVKGTPEFTFPKGNCATSGASCSSRSKHEKPKKKGLIGKIGDLFD